MLRPLVAGSLLLVLGSIASSQPDAPDDTLAPIAPLSSVSVQPPQHPTGKPAAATKTKAIGASDAAKTGDRSVDSLEQCLRDWDSGTHMTRQEWARTCRRVVSNRTK